MSTVVEHASSANLNYINMYVCSWTDISEHIVQRYYYYFSWTFILNSNMN